MDYQEEIRRKKAEAQRQLERKQELETIKKSGEQVAKAVALQTKKKTLELNQTQKVKTVDPVASPEDIKGVVEALNDIIVSQTVTNDDLAESFKDIAAGMVAVADEISELPKEYSNADVVDSIKSLVKAMEKLPKQDTEKQNFEAVVAGLKDVADKVSSLQLDPKIDVQSPNVDVQVPEINIKPIVDAINKIKVDVPETNVTVDTDALAESMSTVKDAVNNLKFPVPNYILPFKDKDGAATQKGLPYISEANSSTTALDDTQVFTGDWEDVSEYDSMTVAVSTDQNGTYSIQFSPDGTNVDSTLTRYHRTTQIEAPHRFTITRKYARVVFTNNSGSNQTYFRLQTLFGDKQPLNVPVDGVVSQDYDATVVRPTDYKTEVALGRRQGSTLWNKFGYNADLDVGTEVIAEFGGTLTPLTTASTLTIVSSSTDDDGDPVGIGAQQIILYGVDANRKSQIEVVTMNGTTNVVTTSTWLGINRAAIYLAGSSLGNVGKITITATTGGSTQATMPAGEGTTQQAIFFVQADHVALADTLIINVNKISGGTSPVVTIKGWVYSAVANAKFEVFRETLDTNVENTVSILPQEPFPISEKSVFWLEGTTNTANTVVSARFSLIEHRDVDA